ncbi:MAG TPA: hypothetical protein GX524_02125, partial [Firmicutes bacterium]|nr:hypothetical protein [Bacillota bacterium]
MGPLLGFAGMIGTLAFLVLLIVAVVRKRNKKPYVVGIAVAFVVFAVGLAITPGSDPNSVGGPLSSDTSGQEPAQTAKSQTGDFVEPAQTLEQSADSRLLIISL